MKNDNYISWTEYFMSLAVLSSKRSKDPKTQVGACIVNNITNKVVSLGYNGFPRGCSDDIYPWDKIHGDDYNSKYMYVVHAEMNAILNTHLNDSGKYSLYVTHSPCADCMKAIIQSGIETVYYLHQYDPESSNTKASFRMAKSANINLIPFTITDVMTTLKSLMNE